MGGGVGLWFINVGDWNTKGLSFSHFQLHCCMETAKENIKKRIYFPLAWFLYGSFYLFFLFLKCWVSSVLLGRLL